MVNFTPTAAFSDVVFAAELGVSLLNINIDAVAVYDSNFNQVFQNARPMEAEILPRARLMDHPVEPGQIETDYKIINPTEILLPVIIQDPYYRTTYQEIYNLWESSEKLIVQCKVGTFSNMIITEPPSRESPDKYDAIVMRLRFRQIQIPGEGSNFMPADINDADTQILGQQFPSIYTIIGSAAGVATTLQAINAEFR